MGKRLVMACIMGSIADTGNEEPIAEKLKAAHREQILMDIRREGNIPNANIPNAWPESMARMPNKIILNTELACGKCNTPYIINMYIDMMVK